MGIKEKTRANPKFRSGFTVVELIVVVVCIAILATLVLVAYSSMTERAARAEIMSHLGQAGRVLESDKVLADTYPADLQIANNGKGISAPKDYTYQYTTTGTGSGSTYCMTITRGKVSMFIDNQTRQPADGFCPGHFDPNLEASVAYAGVQNFNTPSATDVTFPIPVTLVANDSIFVVMSVDYNTTIRNFTLGATPVTGFYRKSMGFNGYQAIVAYIASGQTGTQSITFNPGWTPDPNYPSAPAQKGQLAIYVIRDLAKPTSVQSTDTSFGSQAPNSLVAPAAMSTTRSQFAVFASVYYGNYLPVWTDGTSPVHTWVAHNSRINGTTYPFIDTHYAILPASTSVYPGVTMPGSGAIYLGATTFLLGG